LNVKKVTYVYHKNWPVYENYISGKYDNNFRDYMNFLLWESPWETFKPISKTDSTPDGKTIRAAFSNYPNIFEYDKEKDMYSGMFYEILNLFKEKFGFEIIFVEETGYGVIENGLIDNRFDLFASTIWPTESRQEKISFSISLFESPVYIYIRENELNDKLDGKLVVVKQNDISEYLADKFFIANRKVYLPQLYQAIQILEFLADEKGDFTFVEESLADEFNSFSTSKVKKFQENPIYIFDNCFAFSKSNIELKNLLDNFILELKAKGQLDTLVQKYLD
jgi:ABC-type amino acid transport substrate-binding protein